MSIVSEGKFGTCRSSIAMPPSIPLSIKSTCTNTLEVKLVMSGESVRVGFGRTSFNNFKKKEVEVGVGYTNKYFELDHLFKQGKSGQGKR